MTATTSTTRRIAAGIAAATLSLAVVSCSSDDAKNATDAAKSVGAEASDAAGSAAAGASGAAESALNGSDSSEGADPADPSESGASGETTKISTSAGEVEVPSEFASAIKEKAGEWGEVQNVESTDAGSLATFAEDKLLAFSKDSGTQPIIGKIAETWNGEGGLANKVGLPTAPEQAQGTGWVQKFTNGTITWDRGEGGSYEATVE